MDTTMNDLLMSRYARFFVLHKQLVARGASRDRAVLVEQFTGKGSLKELSDREYRELIAGMEVALKLPEPDTSRQRKRIIANFYNMGYGQRSVETARSWAEKRLKKSWNSATVKELTKLVAISDRALSITMHSFQNGLRDDKR